MGSMSMFAPRDNKRMKGIVSLTTSSPPEAEIGWIVSTSLNPPLPLLLPDDPLPLPLLPSTLMSAITLTVQRYGLDSLPMPMPAAGSIRTAYDVAPSMHDPYSACLDDNNDDDLLYLSSRPQNVNHIRNDKIDDDNDASGRDDNVSWNNDSAAYTLRFCIAISSFDGMLL